MFSCKHMYQPGSFRQASQKKIIPPAGWRFEWMHWYSSFLPTPWMSIMWIRDHLTIKSENEGSKSPEQGMLTFSLKILQDGENPPGGCKEQQRSKILGSKSQRSSVTGDHRRSWEQHPAIGQVSAKRVSHVPCAAPMKRHSAWPCGFRNKKLQQTSAQMYLKPWNH